MVNIQVLLLVFLTLVIAWSFDRFVLKRGAVTLNSCSLFDMQGEYWRFVLAYTIRHPIYWGEIRYQLTDKSDPSTVITGRARTLDHAIAGVNNEFLLIKERLTATSTQHKSWKVHIVVNTVVDHWNPLYKYFPLSTSKTFEVTLNAN